ncbi:glucose-1-phosphate adenylyltransferase [Endozoicomonas gorgoniicola]|uniref:Glucose-1-phosphate adenylyltransferase n=1 Tax=Endozoicomonas gorgoniicola TaxID=1234144 RepID=A0ABT3MXU2_9GAMM|nr:glucose-1-phosphate adenylyltransferase [Endozoicomonas gorgoniicola]MCW7554191.1 glucose-1-phosphate adenylyltransferase [Endozoicomonas gorgoniicola]
MSSILSMILAGGEGSRLSPLTGYRAKPAVPFVGQYRIIDFVLSNFVNSDLHKIYVLTQFKSHSLNKHLQRCWRIAGLFDKFIDTLPAQMWTGQDWYQGTADAIFQNLHLIESQDPEQVVIFGGDHIYTMDVRKMVNLHEESDAALTVAAIPVPVEEAYHFGIIEIDETGRMIGFEEKPKTNPKTIPGNPNFVLASMGNYIFERKCLERVLREDHLNEESSHDFGKDIIPKLFPKEKVMVYNFAENEVPGSDKTGYWRDVGTLDAYWEANMDLLSENPPIELHNLKWPINTYVPPYPPALIAFDRNVREGHINNSMIGTGCIVNDVFMDQSVVGYNVEIDDHSHISDSVILPNVKIGAGCEIRKAIIDKRAEIAPGTKIGVNLDEDRKLFKVTDSGIVVIPRGTKVGF